MSEAISGRRKIACAAVVAAFAVLVWFAVQWRSQPPPPPAENKALLEKIEKGQ
jgi:hypothetical protein